MRHIHIPWHVEQVPDHMRVQRPQLPFLLQFLGRGVALLLQLHLLWRRLGPIRKRDCVPHCEPVQALREILNLKLPSKTNSIKAESSPLATPGWPMHHGAATDIDPIPLTRQQHWYSAAQRLPLLRSRILFRRQTGSLVCAPAHHRQKRHRAEASERVAFEPIPFSNHLFDGR